MTHIEIFYHGNIIYGFRMEGHAGYNLNGPDVVCASLSAVSQMTVNGVLDWLGVDLDECLKEQNQMLGLLHFEVPLELYTNTTIHQLFRAFEMYVTSLSEMFEENIKVERRYDNDNSD